MKLNIDSGWFSFVIEGTINNAKQDDILKEGISNLVFRGALPKARAFTGAKAKLEESAPYDEAKAKLAVEALSKALADYGTWDITYAKADRGAGLLAAQAARFAEEQAAYASYKGLLAAGVAEDIARAGSRYKGPAGGPAAPAPATPAPAPTEPAGQDGNGVD